MAGIIGDVTKDKRGLADQYMAQVLGQVTLQSRNNYAEFSIDLVSGTYATLIVTFATTNNNTCTLLITISKWNKDYVSDAISIGDKSAIYTAHYRFDGNKCTIYLRPNDNYAQVRVRYLSWWGAGNITSSVATSLPSGVYDITLV